MARAVFAIGLSLAYMSAALSPHQEVEIHRLEDSMSVDDALQQLDDKLPAQIATLVQGFGGEGAARKTRTFMETGGHGIRKGILNKKGVEDARIKMNQMVEDTQAKWDKESVECEAMINNQKAIMEETAADMTLYRSQNTQAKGDHLRAEGEISRLDTTSTKLEDELTQVAASCTESMGQLNQEIAIMVNDSLILQKIVAMIDCPGKSALVHCKVNVTYANSDNVSTTTEQNFSTFHNSELRAEMAKLQSDKVKGLMDGAVFLAFKSGDGPKPISRAAFFQQGDNSAQTLKRRQRVLRGGQPDVAPVAPSEAQQGDGPGPNEEPCSLETNPNCGKLQDKFMEIAGEVDSDITVYSKHLEERKKECVLERENYEAQINDLSGRLENWQTALAEATQRAITAGEGERLKRGQYNELSLQFGETNTQCTENLANFKSEICALGKIRGELYKMSAVPKFIEDCEVSEWIYGDCSKPCMESVTDVLGIQNLTREVTTPASLGAGCPPLKLHQVCNQIRCPISCLQSEWSEWSGCSSQCGGGVRERIRSTKRSERYNGEPCGPASATETCNLQDCDKDCALGAWSKLQNQKCTKACGGGVKTSSRPIAAAAIGQGSCPDPFSHDRYRETECNILACEPTDASGVLKCDSEVDVVILLDGSGSLGKKGWAATVAMGQKLVAAFDVPALKALVAVQLFSGPSTYRAYDLCNGKPRPKDKDKEVDMEKDCGISWVTPLTTETGHFTTDLAKASELVKGLKWPAKSTFTSLALAQAQAELLYARDGVTKVVVVVTDGVPINAIKTTEASSALKGAARLIWVPVTAAAPKDQLVEWASRPTEQNVVWVDDFKALETPEIVTQIIAEVCPEAH